MVNTIRAEAVSLPQWQMDDDGNHRIVKGKHIGGWARYESPAVLTDGATGTQFVAFTQYFEGTVPTECVLTLKATHQEPTTQVPGIRPA